MDHLDGVQLARYGVPLKMGLYIETCFFPSPIGVFQREAKKGERGFCLKKHDGSLEDPENPDEVAWPNATEVLDDCIKTQYFENSGLGFLPQVMRNFFSEL